MPLAFDVTACGALTRRPLTFTERFRGKNLVLAEIKPLAARVSHTADQALALTA